MFVAPGQTINKHEKEIMNFRCLSHFKIPCYNEPLKYPNLRHFNMGKTGVLKVNLEGIYNIFN